MLREGELGIHPPGALGVAFFVHAEAECFIGRGGDGITQPLKEVGAFKLAEGSRERWVPLDDRMLANLLEADALDHMPELLFVCCNPDQLGLFTGELTRFLENLCGRGRLKTLEDVHRRVPILLILPNGILSEQTLGTYEEQLNESLLLQRLPGVTDELLPALMDRVVRGVSLQAGGRRGTGRDTVYVLERKGLLVFAGGGEFERDRVEKILTSHAYPFKHARGVPGTRVEFDKAMISIVLNVGGLIHTVKPSGDLIDLRMGDLCKDTSKASFVEKITRAVFDTGKAAGAYPPDATYDEVWAAHRATILAHAGHVTSSLKTFRDALSSGLDSVRLFSNEEWILTPLAQYAAKTGLKKEEELFRKLGREVQTSMARAIQHRDGGSGDDRAGTSGMNLTAQRNINIELFEAGNEELVLVGTMLDNDHLIKLEMTIYLPDEQITRSKLNMVRVPFPVCREVESVAERLVGLRIERGVLSEIVQRVGGRVGCSHIKELATNIIYLAASYLVHRRVGVDPMSTEYIHKPADEWFTMTKGLLRDSCLAYCQTTPHGLDERIGIQRIGEEHVNPLPLGEYESTLGVLLADRASRWGDKTYFRWREGDKEHSLSWKEFAAKVRAISRHLIARGVGPRDRIAMISENRVEMYLFELAAMSIGAVSVPVFAGYPPPQIEYVLGHSHPKLVAVSGFHQLEKIDRKHHPRIEGYFCMDFGAKCKKWGATDFAELTGKGGAKVKEFDERVAAVGPDDVCMVMYTSGTTGAPKGVCLTHRNLISQRKSISLLWDVGEDDVLMAYLPWHHSFGGLYERLLSLYVGCEFCLDDSRGRDLDRLLSNWKAFNPSLFFSVPRVHDLLVTRCREDSKAERTVFGDRLRFVMTAGALLPATVEAEYRKRDIPVVEGWGLTETAPCVTLTTTDQSWRSGYVGFPLPGISLRIADDQEILVKGPFVMAGYLDDEEATSRVLDANGWFHSGDLGEFTKDGLRVLGRKDGAFKLTTGEKVHPQRVETALVNESPYIRMAVALGGGEDYVAALIYPNMNRLCEWATEQGVPADGLLKSAAAYELFTEQIASVNSGLEVKYQRVRRAVLIDDEPTLAGGELTPSGKLVRSAVIDHHKNTVTALFAPEPGQEIIEVDKQRELQRT